MSGICFRDGMSHRMIQKLPSDSSSTTMSYVSRMARRRVIYILTPSLHP
jgi:hypothetical protein